MLQSKKTEELTFDEAIEQIKTTGEKEKQTVEIADELARIINDLANARVRENLSQRDLAEKSGLKQSAIARMESLQVVPRLDTIIRIAKSLNVQLMINSQKEIVCDSMKVVFIASERSAQSRYSSIPLGNTTQKGYAVRRRNQYAAIG